MARKSITKTVIKPNTLERAQELLRYAKLCDCVLLYAGKTWNDGFTVQGYTKDARRVHESYKAGRLIWLD